MFALNLLVFGVYGLLIGLVGMAIALRFAYGKYGLWWFAVLYAVLSVVAVGEYVARSGSVLKLLDG